MGRTVLGSNPGRKKILFSSPKRPDRLQLNWRRSYLPEIKQPECKVGRSPPSSTDVKNGWSYTYTSLTYFYGMDRDNFTNNSYAEIAILASYTSRDSGSKQITG
jgi:hypothetical protein